MGDACFGSNSALHAPAHPANGGSRGGAARSPSRNPGLRDIGGSGRWQARDRRPPFIRPETGNWRADEAKRLAGDLAGRSMPQSCGSAIGQLLPDDSAPIVANCKRLTSYWREDYRWPDRVAVLNRLPHFRATIDGYGLHFLHFHARITQSIPRV
jgi:Epoxide hydrolase N terminus